MGLNAERGQREMGEGEVASPCAACKMLRRRCVRGKCVLAPYFPPDDPHKFATAHRVFGACNIIKILQDIPEERRADAVSSMVYEASARVRDPIYGCAGAVCQLQHQISRLQSQLATAHAQIFHLRLQHVNLLSLVAATNPALGLHESTPAPMHDHDQSFLMPSKLSDEDTHGLWDPLWT